jgi:ATP-dependent DNA ligase
MRYDKFRYLFPPRPEVKAPPASIKTYEKMGMWAQPKLNGSCSLLFTDGNETVFMNRHQKRFSRELLDKEELKRLHVGKGWTVLVGEYMNKSQRGPDRKVFNAKFVIFDILVYEGEYLIGSTFRERQELLDRVYLSTPHDEWLDRISENIYRVHNFKVENDKRWQNLVKIEMYEGMVFKKPDGKLGTGYSGANNTGWQVKVRKPTRNYSY